MKKTLQSLFVLSAFFLFLSSCKEFIEPSLEDKKVCLNSPAENHESNKYNQSFWWDEVDDADTYRLQIASPSFDSIAFLVIDTLVESNKFNFTLDPDEYEWRVRAENSSSHGYYSSRKLIIHESSITTQKVQLQSPGNGILTNEASLTFRWYSLFGSENYRFQVDTNNFSDEKDLVINLTTPSLESTVNLSADKLYQWRVSGESAAGNSKWSQIQTFTRDATAPAKVELTSPATGQVASKPVNLQWTAVPGAVRYELMISASESGSPYNSTFPLSVNGLSHAFTGGEFNETIYWKVRAIDGAGNVGFYSNTRNFTVQ